MLSSSELAKTVGITSARINQILKDRNLEFVKTQKNGHIRVPHTTVATILEERGLAIKSEILSHFILKGGTGKTLLNVNYAHWLSERSKKPILLIDLDGEGCATNTLANPSEIHNPITIYEILRDNLKIKDHLLKTRYPNLYILPCKLAALKSERITTGRNPKLLLKSQLDELKESFGSIIFDMPPNLNTLTVSALLALSKLVIPVNSDIYSLESLELTLDSLKEYSAEFESKMPPFHILINKFQANTIAATDTYKAITKYYGDKLIPTHLKLTAQINNATNLGKMITEGCHQETKSTYREIASFIAEYEQGIIQ